MKLNNETVKTLIDGALWCETLPDGSIFPHRFTKKQEDFYFAATQFDFRIPAAAGVRLDVVTDADELRLTAHTRYASSRRFCYIDAAVDGVLVCHEGMEDTEGCDIYLTVPLPAGEHRVTVFFPGLFSAAIREISLTDGASVAPVRKKRRLLALGDSITQGYDAVFPSLAYPTRLAMATDAALVNQGVGGEVFRPDMLAPLPYDPDIITVAYGTNDYSGRDPEKASADAGLFYRRLRDLFPRARVFALTPVWRLPKEASRFASFEAARDMVRRAAAGIDNCVVIEGDGLLPHLPAMCSDGYLHPNDLGFCLYADALVRAVTPYLP